MNEVHLPTRLATHGLIGLAGFIGHIVRDQALDAKASVWAAEEEGRHRSASQRTTVGALRWIKPLAAMGRPDGPTPAQRAHLACCSIETVEADLTAIAMMSIIIAK